MKVRPTRNRCLKSRAIPPSKQDDDSPETQALASGIGDDLAPELGNGSTTTLRAQHAPDAGAAADRQGKRKRRTHGMAFKVEPQFYRSFTISAVENGRSNVEFLEMLYETWRLPR
jgi:hypothetical protein